MVNDSRARFVNLSNRGDVINLAPNCEPKFITRRMSVEEFNDFLSRKNARHEKDKFQKGEEIENDMSKKDKTKKGSNKKAAEGAPAEEYVSRVGRSEYIRGLKAKEVKFDDAMEDIRAKFPGSSSGACRKVWDAKPRGSAKPAKPGTKAKTKAPAKKKLNGPPARKSTPKATNTPEPGENAADSQQEATPEAVAA
jgi:hypothetical protein